MRTPASIANHPIHPMLVSFPIGLWVFSFVCDLIGLMVDEPSAWSTVAFYTMVGGLVGALCAAIPGFIDYRFYQGGKPPLKRIARMHMTVNLIVVVLYALNIWLRVDGPSRGAPVVLSALGVALLVLSGWLGGQMVHVYGVGVIDRE